MNQGETRRSSLTDKMRRRVRALLLHRHLPFIVAGLALILTLPALNAGRLMDDLFHRAVLEGVSPLSDYFDSPLDVFRFFDGDPKRTWSMVERGIVPWWTYPGIKAAFWRPVTALTHWLDYALWPERAWLMHAQTLLWYAGLAAAATALYRRVFGTCWVAGLAAIVYAIDDAHGMPVGWLAGRNALLAAFFGVFTLLMHDRWRRDGSRAGAVLAPLLLLVSLLSAEAGIATCAYLFAHVVFIDRANWDRRCLVLLPYIVVVLAWRVTWSALGYGVAHMELYVDPLAEPVRFLIGVVYRAPVLLTGQWGGVPAEVGMLLPQGQRVLLSVAAAVFLLVLVLLLIPLLRRDRIARFWATGMALSLLPVCATFPADRLLMFAGIGVSALVAQLLADLFGDADWKPVTRLWLGPAKVFGYLMVLVHLVLAPLALPFRAGYPMGPKSVIGQLYVHTPMNASVLQQDVIIVNAPEVMHAMYLPLVRRFSGEPAPRRTRPLAPGVPAVTIRRPDERTLGIRPEKGYLTWIFDRLFRDKDHPMWVGQRVRLPGMTVEITELTADGRPAEAVFRFDVPLEDPSLRWLQWKDGEFVPFVPPPVGATVELRPRPPALYLQ